MKKDNFIDTKKTELKNYILNTEQLLALKFLEKVNDKFDVSVLQGTTGSGKTLVYFERIKKIIQTNKQAFASSRNIFNK